MSCVREASLEPPAPYHAASGDPARNGEGRKGRFFRGLRRMFRRRAAPPDHSPDSKSRSTSELLQDIRQRRKEGAYSSGLSVSHDSVFTGDRSADESSDERAAHTAHISTGHRAELAAAVRRRGRGDGSDDDEDLGLPSSPPASPPTDKADKRHHAAISASSCSDGSLLSVGSSEMDEESSQHDSARSDLSEYTGEPPSGVAPLSHSAARHKMAVRPRRTHGAPRRNKNMPIATPALPITPELNEEMIRSTTPEVSHKTEVVTESFSSSTTTKAIMKETHSQLSKELNRTVETTSSDAKLKSSSLPPGLALSQLVGQSPAKLSLAENKDTPRSSIKRSKSSTQGKSLSDEQHPSKLTASETNVNREEARKKESKEDKKEKKEDGSRASRKDESFFTRLLLRRSKKDPKVKKDAENDKKPKPPDKLLNPQYKSVDREYSSTHEYGKIQPRTQSADRGTQIAHKVFSNQPHKRMDSKGVYTHDTAYSISKSSIDYGANDLKIAEETDKLLNMDLKYSYRPDTSKRLKEDLKDDPFNLHMPERWKKPVQVVDPYQPKAFNKEANVFPRDNTHLSPKIITDEVPDAPIPIPRQRPKDFVFHSGSMPKNIPYFNHHLKLSASASPPKSVLLQNSDNIKKLHRSSDLSTIGIPIAEPEEFVAPVFGDYPTTQAEKDYASELRSLGDEYIEPRTAIRTSIGKSHSFRHQSEVNSISSQDQMPSLPTIVGFSENLMESWETNYRRSVSHDASRFNDRTNENKRLSARNYGIFGPGSEQYDSLQSTDSSYLDSLKGETQVEDRKPIFINSVVINEGRKRDSDISQIEANIDNIIRSPKPLISTVLKSSSLDSVKSCADKNVEDRRKTISIESSLAGHIVDKDAQEVPKSEPETYVSITHLNREVNSLQTKTVESKLSKSDEKLKTTSKPGVPEFLNIQLNKVDSKPATNVVLMANLTPKKTEPVVVENNVKKESDSEKDSNETPLQMYLRKTGSQHLLNRSMEFLGEEPPKIPEKPTLLIKNSPLNTRKSAPPTALFQAPTTPKTFLRKKPIMEETKLEKQRTNSLGADCSEKLGDNIAMDQKSYSSFGSKTSLQSSDSNEAKTPEKQEDGVVYRRKPMIVPKEQRNGSKNDDEPELMKVFARRSLKLKDSEAEILAQEIAEANLAKDELNDSNFKSKFIKNEFNSSIKSRDSDKENEDNLENADIKIIDLDSNKEIDDLPNIQSRANQFGGTHYQRSISTNSVSSIPTNTKRDSAPAQMRNEVSKYRKEIADSTPEKRLRNRTFPDPTTDREDIKGINTKNDAYKADTIKRPWLQKKEDDRCSKLNVDDKDRNNAVNDAKESAEAKKDVKDKEHDIVIDGSTDGSPQFKGILQMRAEWERRAKQGMTK